MPFTAPRELSTRLFPISWGHPPDDPSRREAWIRSNIELGEHERRLGIPVPWLGRSPMGPRKLAEIMGRRLDALDHQTADDAQRRLLDLQARRHDALVR